MTAKPKEKIEVRNNHEPIYGGDVISGVKSLFPGLVEEHQTRTEELRHKRENELSALSKDERYSDDYLKIESEKIKSDFNALIEAEEVKHRTLLQNSITQLRAEERSVIHADDEEEGAYQNLLDRGYATDAAEVLANEIIAQLRAVGLRD